MTTPRPRTVSSSRTISALRPDCETSTSSVPAAEQPSLVVEQLRGLDAGRSEPRFHEAQVQRDEAEVRRAHARQHHAAQVAVAQPSRDVLERGGRLEAAVSLRERARLLEDVAKVGAFRDAQ